jgi:hypothetical protein
MEGTGPAALTAVCGARSRRSLGVQRVRDAAEPVPGGRQLEDPPHDRCLGLVDLPVHMGTTPIRAGHRHIVVPVLAARRYMARARLPHHCVPSARTGLDPLHLVGEGGHGEEELLGRTVEGPLPVLQVVEDTDPAVMSCFRG